MEGKESQRNSITDLPEDEASRLKDQVFESTQFNKIDEYFRDYGLEPHETVAQSTTRDGLIIYQLNISYSDTENPAHTAFGHWVGAHPETIKNGVVDATAYGEQLAKKYFQGTDELDTMVVVEPGTHASIMYGLGPEKTIVVSKDGIETSDVDYGPLTKAIENSDGDISELFGNS
ncbi:hypothetical protein [Halopiger goleimassiliensis]|uniref:hypothetical protein n=1 Tax=Halopiger goleimassiliensis TaxID=1293048 RepID=UPI0012B5A854|nr:hypothetical protein [Halopiger goleimassiliensis]